VGLCDDRAKTFAVWTEFPPVQIFLLKEARSCLLKEGQERKFYWPQMKQGADVTFVEMEAQMRATLSIALFFLLLGAPVQALDRPGIDERNIEFGDVLVCDTQEQAERYAALYHGDKEAAVRAVNREANDPRACGAATAAFVRGPQMATARAENMAFEIVRILVLGIDSQDGFRPVRPAPYFTAFGVTEYDV
jgi:hypothetical protein